MVSFPRRFPIYFLVAWHWKRSKYTIFDERHTPFEFKWYWHEARLYFDKRFFKILNERFFSAFIYFNFWFSFSLLNLMPERGTLRARPSGSCTLQAIIGQWRANEVRPIRYLFTIPIPLQSAKKVYHKTNKIQLKKYLKKK